MDQELSERFERFELAIGQTIQREIRASEARLRQHTDEVAAGLRQDIDRVAQETRRTGVIVEGLRSDFRVATEGFTAVNRRLDVVEAQASRTEQRVDVLESRVGAVEAPKSRRRRPRSS